MQVQNAVIVLADISGYTRFIKLHGMALVHAESIITELLDSIIEHSTSPLTLNKLQGDAVLFYAIADEDPRGVASNVLQQVNGFFQAFSTRKQEIGVDALCNCGGCTEVVNLCIKAVVNYGGIVVRKVRQFDEISGTPVIVAHRLLKNSVPLDEYVLLGEDFEQLLEGSLPAGTRITEQCTGIGSVEASYYPPAPYTTEIPQRNLGRQLRLVRSAVSYTAKRYLQRWFGARTGREFRNLQ